MKVKHTQLSKVPKEEQGEDDIPMEEELKIAEDVHDYITRRMGTDK